MSKKPSAPHDHTGVARILEFPPDVYMPGSTSDVLIADWINGPLGKKHFSAWTADFQKKGNSTVWTGIFQIRQCGKANQHSGTLGEYQVANKSDRGAETNTSFGFTSFWVKFPQAIHILSVVVFM